MDVEKRLQFVITLVLFFPIILTAMYSYADSKQNSMSVSALTWGTFIFLYLVSYLVIEVRKDSCLLSH